MTWWGSTQGSSRVRLEVQEWTPGPLTCGTLNLHILRSSCLPAGIGLGLQPGSAISASWFGRYEPSPGVIWVWDPTWQRQLCELVTPWLLLWMLQLSTLLLMILSIWLYPVSMGRHIGGWLLWESSLSGISLGCGSPYPLIWVKITNGRCGLWHEMLNLIRAKCYKIVYS